VTFKRVNTAHMAATRNTLKAMWGKTSAPKAKELSSDNVTVHSTRSRAAEERSAPEREATSRLSKPDIACNDPAKEAYISKENVQQSSMQVLNAFPAACTSCLFL